MIDEIAIPREIVDTLKEYLEAHAMDIKYGINDFGDLRNMYIAFIGQFPEG